MNRSELCGVERGGERCEQVRRGCCTMLWVDRNRSFSMRASDESHTQLRSRCEREKKEGRGGNVIAKRVNTTRLGRLSTRGET